MAVSGLWQSGSGMYVDCGSGRVALALCLSGQGLGCSGTSVDRSQRSGTSVDGSRRSGTFFHGGSDRKAVTCALVGST